MKKLWLLLVLFLFIGSSAYATQFEQITVSSTVIGFTASKIGTPYPPAVAAACSLEGGSIRWTTDGTTPTTLIGHLMVSGDKIMLKGRGDIQNFKAIRVTLDGTLSCSYYSEMYE